MKKQNLFLGDLLIEKGLLTREQLEKALKSQQKDKGDFLGAVLVRLGFVDEAALALTLSHQLNIPFISKEAFKDKAPEIKSLIGLIPESFARKHAVLPLSKNSKVLTVALADPTDIVLLDNLRKLTKLNIEPVIAAKSDIERSIADCYGEGSLLQSAIDASYDGSAQSVEKEESLSRDKLAAEAEAAPVIQLTNLLIEQAVRSRSSDIHIEPSQKSFVIRLRKDGVLQPIPPPDRSMLLPLTSRIKILPKLDIAERRLPQDGSFSFLLDNRSIDLRVSTIPTIYGEKVVLRILDREAVALDLNALGFSPKDLEVFRGIIRRPSGLVLVTGPTGSGKTTTLYSALSELRSNTVNITTIEDPVEYKIAGINQVQAKPAIGLTFAAGLRSFLRQDPDIIFVGEVRDLETAQICIRAALTGHMVFSSIHTNDAASTVNRLVDIGIEPYLVASSLSLIVAQRLLRKLCPKCKESYAPQASSLPKNFSANKSATIYKAAGCEACGKTGYAGRMAIYEILPVSDAVRELVTQKASMVQIQAEARKTGMKTLEESCYQKVLQGETSLEEILRVVVAD